ncbi:MAG: hypothetical protein E7L17_12930 [Clostridium sp.]|uniref:hypothetical protein n=1 Tax=Clostridium sp. TaxID=1506 RepID=UPI00291345EF|nr:hypothetical protein [Clostridium sp.]MDU7339005.1 hypothetical protein [Clostridium sp.]
MTTITIAANQIYNEVSKKVVESTSELTVSISGNTFDHKDFLKSKGFNWDDDRKEWYYTTNRSWFKENAYHFVREIAITLGVKASGIIITGVEAKEAMKTMNK